MCLSPAAVMRYLCILVECALLSSLAHPLRTSDTEHSVHMKTASTKQVMLLLAPPQPARLPPNATTFYHTRRCGHAAAGSGCTLVGSDWDIRTGIMAAPTDSLSMDHLSRLCRLHCSAMASCVAFSLAIVEGTDTFRQCKVHQLDDLRELVPCLTVDGCYSPRDAPPEPATLVGAIPHSCSSLHDDMSACSIYSYAECAGRHINSTCARNCCIRREQQLMQQKARSKQVACALLPHQKNKRLFWVSSMNAANPGDVFSQALFGLFPHMEQMIVSRLEITWNAALEADALCLSKQDLVIVGGGGLLHHSDRWTRSLLQYCRSATCVLWAPGFNKHSFEMTEQAAPLVVNAGSRTVDAVNHTQGAQSDHRRRVSDYRSQPICETLLCSNMNMSMSSAAREDWATARQWSQMRLSSVEAKPDMANSSAETDDRSERFLENTTRSAETASVRYIGAEEELLKLSAAAAFRDYNRDGKYIRMLDASCLLPHFDCEHRPKGHCKIVRDVGWYLHADSKDLTRQLQRRVGPNNLEYNDVSLDAALEFICSSRVVFSMSYHGVLWAVYFGKPVVAVGQFSEKFDGFPFALRRESLESAEALVDSVKTLAESAAAWAEESLTEDRGYSMADVVQPIVNAAGLLADCRLNNTRFFSSEVLPLLGLNQTAEREARNVANSMLAGDKAQYSDLKLRSRIHKFVSMVAMN